MTSGDDLRDEIAALRDQLERFLARCDELAQGQSVVVAQLIAVVERLEVARDRLAFVYELARSGTEVPAADSTRGAPTAPADAPDAPDAGPPDAARRPT